MKFFIPIILATLLFVSCTKEEQTENINVEGYWNVQKDTTFTSIVANATADLYHLFKGSNAYYRFSFPKTTDFSVLTTKPKSDSLISFYQVKGNMLMIPNPAPSTSNNVPGNILVSKTADQMVFTREIVVKRNAITAVIEKTRIDTIKYFRVTDPVKVAFFDNYLKKWHP